ncbi:hypothetical protein PJN92_29000, partial [Mycobacterium kansasii]
IKDGASVETGSLASLRHLSRTRVEATLARPVDLANTAGVHDLQADGDRVSFSVESADLGRLLGELAAAPVAVRGLRIAPWLGGLPATTAAAVQTLF